MWSQQQWELWRQPAAEAELPHDMVAAVVGVGDDDDVLILKWSGGLIVGQMDWTQVFSEHKSVETLQMTQTSSWGLARPQKNEHMGPSGWTFFTTWSIKGTWELLQTHSHSGSVVVVDLLLHSPKILWLCHTSVLCLSDAFNSIFNVWTSLDNVQQKWMMVGGLTGCCPKCNNCKNHLNATITHNQEQVHH